VAETAESMVHEFSARQIRDLLSLAAGSGDEREWLVEVADRDLMESLLSEMCGTNVESAAGLIDSVCSPDSPVEVLIAAKDLAKSLAAKVEEGARLGAVTLLYHLSIASALAYHGQNISSTARRIVRRRTG